MPVIPLLPLFHRFNSQFFENSLAVNNQPLVKVRWSDNRLKTKEFSKYSLLNL